jgi:hypothetical protein
LWPFLVGGLDPGGQLANDGIGSWSGDGIILLDEVFVGKQLLFEVAVEFFYSKQDLHKTFFSVHIYYWQLHNNPWRRL